MAECSRYTVETLIQYLRSLEQRELAAQNLPDSGGELCDLRESPEFFIPAAIFVDRRKLREFPDVKRFQNECELAGFPFDAAGAEQFLRRRCKTHNLTLSEIADWPLQQLCDLVNGPIEKSPKPEFQESGAACGEDQTGQSMTETAPELPPQMKWQEAAERLKRLRQQGESFTSYRKLADQIGCSASTIHKAIINEQSLSGWAKRDKNPKAQSFNDVVADKTPQSRELSPEEDYRIREYLERDDLTEKDRALFNGMRPLDQIAYLDKLESLLDDADSGQRVFGRKP